MSCLPANIERQIKKRRSAAVSVVSEPLAAAAYRHSGLLLNLRKDPA